MARENIDNKVHLIGTVKGELTFDHEVFGEKFYKMMVSIIRNSGAEDIIPVIVSDRLVEVNCTWDGTRVEIYGQFRSYNLACPELGRSKLILTVFTCDISCGSDLSEDEEDVNEIHLLGHVCKPTRTRTTPLGRDIADFMLAVNRPYGHSDYIPCIAWGRNSRYVGSMNVGDQVLLDGRIQSREYKKRNADGSESMRTAYEVSAHTVRIADGVEDPEYSDDE